MLLANYASDSDDSENETDTPGPSRPAPVVTATVKPKRKAPVKITLDQPKSSTSNTEAGGDEDDEERDVKKFKTGNGPKGGKGSSALLGMLPPPKRKLPASKSSSSSSSTTKVIVPKIALPKPAANLPAPPGFSKEDSDSEDEGMVPRSLQRKEKGKGSVDLFGLGDEASALPSKSKIPSTSTSISITSAPTVADFIPPPPTPNDPYPGYYQTPTGQWAAYDSEYYHSFFPNQNQDINGLEADGQGKGDGRVGRHWEEFNEKGAEFIDIDVSKGLEEARIERERRALAVKPKMPGDEVEYKAVGQIKGLATERHQLSSLLNTAFTQKEELEQRITSNKKNMRVAAQKYGF